MFGIPPSLCTTRGRRAWLTRLVIIAIVGIDGAGKTTLAKGLARQLSESGRPGTYFENAGGRPVLAKLAQSFGRADGIE